jgi:hypothetical protein
MKFYMSYWSIDKTKPLNEYLINLHKLSTHLIKQNYKECFLITDTHSSKYLKDVGYTDIITELDNIPPNHNLNWALGKLYAYNYLAKNNIKFCHLDYDVCIWTPLCNKFLSSDIFVQHLETDIDKQYCIQQFKDYNKNKHLIKEIKENNIAYNMGIFGGNDLNFIQQYSESAIQLTLDSKNIVAYDKMNKTNSVSVACFCEQYYLNICAINFNKKITCLLAGNRNERDAQATEKNYTHLCSSKKLLTIEKRIEERLKEFNLL